MAAKADDEEVELKVKHALKRALSMPRQPHKPLGKRTKRVKGRASRPTQSA